eukprot:9534407-Alexandrium_andersonii.AAC.1
MRSWGRSQSPKDSATALPRNYHPVACCLGEACKTRGGSGMHRGRRAGDEQMELANRMVGRARS